MLALDWANLTLLGAFMVGLLVGVIVTIRLAKILAEFLRGERGKPNDR